MIVDYVAYQLIYNLFEFQIVKGIHKRTKEKTPTPQCLKSKKITKVPRTGTSTFSLGTFCHAETKTGTFCASKYAPVTSIHPCPPRTLKSST